MDSQQKDRTAELIDLVDLVSLPDLGDDDTTVGIAAVLDPSGFEEETATEDDASPEDAAAFLLDDYPEDGEWTTDASSGTTLPLASLIAGDALMDGPAGGIDDREAAEEGVMPPVMEEWQDDVAVTPLEEGDDAEGPAGDEVFHIDTERWGELSDGPGSDRGEDEDVFETMRRLDLSIALPEDAPEKLLVDNVDVAFLGPINGTISRVLFVNGAPVGVGDGLYLSGADQMLHAVSPIGLNDVEATSATGRRSGLFLGTMAHGAFRSTDRGHSVVPINSWFTEGFCPDEPVRLGGCSTSFSVDGQHHPDGFRLFGWTGEGQLYCSWNDGDSWKGPLLKGRSCEGLRAAPAGQDVLVLASSRTEVAVLLLTTDLVHFQKLHLPDRLAFHLTPSNAVFAVVEGMMAVGVDLPGAPLCVSTDRGATWDSIEAISGVTALALNPADPDWIGAAVSLRDGSAAVYVSRDRGAAWRAVFSRDPRRDSGCRISELAQSDEGGGSLIALTAEGAYLIAVGQKELTH